MRGSLFFRTGQNWGNRAYFPKADRAIAPDEVLGAFLAQILRRQAATAAHLCVSHEFGERALLAKALSAKSERKVEVSKPNRGERKELSATCASQCA